MNKATKSITLTLVGTAALLLMHRSCRSDSDSPATTRPAGSTAHAHWWHRPWFGTSGGGYHSTSPGHSFSRRGGFGSTGHFVGS